MEYNALLERRYLSWALVTYADETSIRAVCSSAQHWAYIYHDKDDKEPHYHVLLRYTSQKKFKTILKELSSDQNTLGQQIKSMYGIIHYLTHEGTEKYKYSQSDIKSDDLEFWLKFQEPSDDDSNNPLFVINDILNGVSLRTLLSRYGRTIIFQWRAWHEMARLISYQDQGMKLDYERFSETSEEQAVRVKMQRLFDTGEFLYDPETGEILENYQKTIDNLK